LIFLSVCDFSYLSLLPSLLSVILFMILVNYIIWISYCLYISIFFILIFFFGMFSFLFILLLFLFCFGCIRIRNVFFCLVLFLSTFLLTSFKSIFTYILTINCNFSTKLLFRLWFKLLRLLTLMSSFALRRPLNKGPKKSLSPQNPLSSGLGQGQGRFGLLQYYK